MSSESVRSGMQIKSYGGLVPQSHTILPPSSLPLTNVLRHPPKTPLRSTHRYSEKYVMRYRIPFPNLWPHVPDQLTRQ